MEMVRGKEEGTKMLQKEYVRKKGVEREIAVGMEEGRKM